LAINAAVVIKQHNNTAYKVQMFKTQVLLMSAIVTFVLPLTSRACTSYQPCFSLCRQHYQLHCTLYF